MYIHSVSNVQMAFCQSQPCVNLSFPRYLVYFMDRNARASFQWVKVIPQYCTVHPLLRTIAHAISTRIRKWRLFLYGWTPPEK